MLTFETLVFYRQWTVPDEKL